MTPLLPEVPPGFVDLHSHLLPAIDDGCRDTDDVLDCVYALQQRGYAATVCTPHIDPVSYPGNTPAAVRDWVAQLQRFLGEEGVAYRLLTGGELRLRKGVTHWLQRHGVPTLGDSRLVLCDFWEPKWPRFVDQAFDWLLGAGYTPVLAHPERLRFRKRDDAALDAKLDGWRGRGVRLQGNAEAFSGALGGYTQDAAERWLAAGWYDVLALDLHQPTGLSTRFAGLDRIAALTSADELQRLTDEVPRRWLTPESADATV